MYRTVTKAFDNKPLINSLNIGPYSEIKEQCSSSPPWVDSMLLCNQVYFVLKKNKIYFLTWEPNSLSGSNHGVTNRKKMQLSIKQGRTQTWSLLINKIFAILHNALFSSYVVGFFFICVLFVWYFGVGFFCLFCLVFVFLREDILFHWKIADYSIAIKN